MKTQATPSRHQPPLDLTFKANGETKSKIQGDEFVKDTNPVPLKPASVLKDKIQISPEGISAGGIKIDGLALNSLQDGSLQLKVPMKEGTVSFPGMAGEVRIKIKKNTQCQLNIKLGRPHGAVQIEDIRLEFSRRICFKNPAESMQKDGKKWVKKLADTLADVKIKGLHVNNRGEIDINAQLVLFGFIPAPLPKSIKKQIPKIDLTLDSLLKPSENPAHKSSTFDVAKLIGPLGAAFGDASFDIAINSKPVALKIDNSDIQVSTKEEPIQLAASGTCGIDGEKIVLRLPEHQVQLKSGAANVSVSGTTTFELNAQKHVVLKSDNWNTRIEGKPIQFSFAGLKGSFDGIWKLKTEAKNTEVDLNDMVGHTEGTSVFKVAMSESTRRNFPQLKTFNQKTDFAFYDDGKAKLTKANNAVTEFLSPFTLVSGWPMRLPDPRAVHSFGINSGEFKDLITQRTGAKIHDKNHAVLLADGVHSFNKRLELIENAQKFICLQTLIFKDDETSMQLADALIRAVKRGVDVRVIIDSLGNSADSLGGQNPLGNTQTMSHLLKKRPLYRKLREGGVQLALFSDNAEKGIRHLLQVLQEHPEIAGIEKLTDLKNPRYMLPCFHRIALAARGKLEDVEVSTQDQKKLSRALNEIFNALPGSTSTVLTDDLSRITKDNVLELSEMLSLVERIPTFHSRWHEKIMVTEQGGSIIGGMNLADEYMLGGSGRKIQAYGVERDAWRDTDTYIEGPATKDALLAFEKNWHYMKGEQLSDHHQALKIPEHFDVGMDVQIIHHRPAIDHDHHITTFVIEALKTLKAGEKAYIEQGYVLLTGALETLKIALIEAAKRGVDVRIFTNSEKSSDMHETLSGNVFGYRELLKAGVRIFEQKGTRTLHSKIGTFGSKVAMVGSWNADNRSASINSEITSVLYNEKYTQELEDRITTGFSSEISQEIQLEDIERLPIKREMRNIGLSSIDDFI